MTTRQTTIKVNKMARELYDAHYGELIDSRSQELYLLNKDINNGSDMEYSCRQALARMKRQTQTKNYDVYSYIFDSAYEYRLRPYEVLWCSVKMAEYMNDEDYIDHGKNIAEDVLVNGYK